MRVCGVRWIGRQVCWSLLIREGLIRERGRVPVAVVAAFDRGDGVVGAVDGGLAVWAAGGVAVGGGDFDEGVGGAAGFGADEVAVGVGPGGVAAVGVAVAVVVVADVGVAVEVALGEGGVGVAVGVVVVPGVGVGVGAGGHDDGVEGAVGVVVGPEGFGRALAVGEDAAVGVAVGVVVDEAFVALGAVDEVFAVVIAAVAVAVEGGGAEAVVVGPLPAFGAGGLVGVLGLALGESAAGVVGKGVAGGGAAGQVGVGAFEGAAGVIVAGGFFAGGLAGGVVGGDVVRAVAGEDVERAAVGVEGAVDGAGEVGAELQGADAVAGGVVAVLFAVERVLPIGEGAARFVGDEAAERVVGPGFAVVGVGGVVAGAAGEQAAVGVVVAAFEAVGELVGAKVGDEAGGGGGEDGGWGWGGRGAGEVEVAAAGEGEQGEGVMACQRVHRVSMGGLGVSCKGVASRFATAGGGWHPLLPRRLSWLQPSVVLRVVPRVARVVRGRGW